MKRAPSVRIARRYCGPPDSGNGGYSCGLTALTLTDGSAEVTLRRPPPLERPLRIERVADTVVLVDGDDVVSEGRRADLHVEVPAPVAYDDARQAAGTFDVEAFVAAHAFPTCFTCGPHRRQGDGLRLFPAPATDDGHLVAWPWVPDEHVVDTSGRVDAAVLWAALDCPGGWAWLSGEGAAGPCVLGRMTAAIHRRPVPGDHLVAGGWRVGAEGRKLRSGSVVWSGDGEVLAAASTTWIRLRGEQQAAFGVSGATAPTLG